MWGILSRRRNFRGCVLVVALFVSGAASSTRGAIAVVDTAVTPISNGNAPTQFTIPQFTVSPTADVLIVEVGTRGVNSSADTITFGGQTMTLAVQFPSTNQVFRDSAIYYLYNPTPGAGTIAGQFSPTGITDYVISAFTLGGVNTSLAPITTGADNPNNGGAATTATLTAGQAAGVVTGSFAVMEQTLNGGSGPFTYSATAAGVASGTGAELWEGTSGTNILAAGGSVSNLSAGTDSYTGAATTNTNTKNPLAVAIFTPLTSINWVGGTSSDWATGTNWQGGTAPNGSGAGAIFGNAASNPAVTLLSSGETVGSMIFNSSVNTTIGGSNTLTLSNAGSPSNITVNGGSHAITARISLASDLMVSTAAGSQLTFGAPISQSGGTRALNVGGSGTIVLGAANTFSGPTTVSGGVVRITNDASLINSTATINAPNGLAFGNSVGFYHVGGLAGSGSVALANAANAPITISVGGNNASTLFAGSLSGPGSLSKTGTGTLTLSNASTYNGGTTLLSGKLISGTAASLGTGPVTLSGGTLRVVPAPAPLLTGFGGTSSDIAGTGTGWTVNNTTITSNPINNNVLTLTDNAGNEARSAFFNTPQAFATTSGGFVASFTYTAAGDKAADGVVFMLQNDARGTAALADAGGALGYSSGGTNPQITPSVGIALNIYGGHVIGTNLLTNGGNNGVYLDSTPVNPGSGDPINVTIAYNVANSTVTETLVDTVTNAIFTTQYTNQNLAAILGANTAYVGFSGATGGLAATQTISNFSYGVNSAYANGIVLPAGVTANLDVAPSSVASSVSMGMLTVNGGSSSTLNVTASTAPADTPYGLSLSGATLSGNLTLNVANNGAGTGTVTIGAINDTGAGFGVTKTGPGTLVLAAANTYRGATTVSGGALRLVDASQTSNNNIPTSTTISVATGASLDVTGLMNGRLTLASGQTLKGAGIVTGTVEAAAGSIIGGGSGTTLNIAGALTLDDQSHSSFTLGTPNGSGNATTAFVNVSGGAFAATGNHIVDLAGAAHIGTYELYAYISGAASATQFSVGGNTAGNFNYAFHILANSEVDLIVTNPFNSASWNFDDNGSYSEQAKWNPTQLPNGAGLSATFGNGVTTTVHSPPALTVLIDGAETVGSLTFNNTNGVGYILGNDQTAGHGITLDNNGAGATVAVSANTPQQIQANLSLADNTVFNIAGGSSLLVTVGAISEIGGSRSLALTGGGSLTLDTPGIYSGGTTVTNGTLITTPTGGLGVGPLVASAAASATSLVSLGNDQTITSLSGIVSGGGSATVRVAAGTTLSVNQATNTAFFGVVALQPGQTPHSGGTLAKSAAGTLEIQGAPALANNSNLAVSGGKLKFNVAVGTASIGAGVVATITNSATLELAGPISALAAAGPVADRVDIVNNSSAAAGVLVSGNNQVVGKIDGSGTTQVGDGADLTANHIVQAALVIGGTATSASHLMIAPSDSSGNSLAGPESLSQAGSTTRNFTESLSSIGPLAASSLLAGGLSSGAGSVAGLGGGPRLASEPVAVPEPSMILLAVFGVALSAASFGFPNRCRNNRCCQLNA